MQNNSMIFLSIPEIQIIDRALLVPHVNIERKQIDGGESPTTEDFEERWEAISLLQARKRGRRHGGRNVEDLYRWGWWCWFSEPNLRGVCAAMRGRKGE